LQAFRKEKINPIEQSNAVMIAEGMLLGLTLSFMVGPIMFSIVQAGIEGGFRAGLAAASGIWTCDFLYIVLLRYGVDTMAVLVSVPGFRFWVALLGGILLIVFGLVSLFNKRVVTGDNDQTHADRLLDRWDGKEKPGVAHNWKQMGLHWYWLRGFLLNIVNPGTLFFWIGIATAVVIPNHFSGNEISQFFGSMLAVLIATDTLKAYAAKRLREWLTPGHIRKLHIGIGLTLIVFGLVIAVRAR
jgi:threonine/homoserine/homoserine lactone efflux protein